MNNGYPQYPQQGYPQQQQPQQPQQQGYPQQQQDGRDPSLYVSSLAKNLILHGQKDARGKDQKQRLPFPVKGSNQSEEISFTFSAERLQDLLARITTAMQDPQGTGGVRITLYANHHPNQGRGRPYDGAKVMVYKTNPPQQGFGGQQQRSFGGQQQRPQYPPMQNGPQYPQQGQYNPPPQQMPQQGGYPPTVGIAPQQPQLPPNQYVPPGYPPQGQPAPQPTQPQAAPAVSTPPQQSGGVDQGPYNEDNIPF